MEQFKEIIEILKQTPEMALWGLAIWCLYIILKLASVVYAVKIVFQLAINKWHDYKVKKIQAEKKDSELSFKDELLEFQREKMSFSLESGKISRIAKRFDRMSVSDVDIEDLIKLLDAIKSTSYIHQSDIDKAIKAIEEKKAA